LNSEDDDGGFRVQGGHAKDVRVMLGCIGGLVVALVPRRELLLTCFITCQPYCGCRPFCLFVFLMIFLLVSFWFAFIFH
jgi:hypothetical protein